MSTAAATGSEQVAQKKAPLRVVERRSNGGAEFIPPIEMLREIMPWAWLSTGQGAREEKNRDLKNMKYGSADYKAAEKDYLAWTARARQVQGRSLHYLYSGSDAAFELWADAWSEQPIAGLRRAWAAYPDDPEYGCDEQEASSYVYPEGFGYNPDVTPEDNREYFLGITCGDYQAAERLALLLAEYSALYEAWKAEHARTQQELAPSSFTVGTLLEADTAPEDQLLVGGLSTVDIWQLYGPTGAGKTLLAMSLAMAVASGAGFVGWAGTEPRRVLYLDGELPDSEVAYRLEYLLQGFSTRQQALIRSNLAMVSREKLHRDYGKELPPLDTPEGEAMLTRLLDLTQPALVVFDSRYCLLQANMLQQDSLPAGLLRRLRERKVAQLWLHHTGKDTGRGGYGDKTAEFLLDANLELTSGHALRFHKKRKARDDNRTFYQDRTLALVDGAWSATSPDNAEERADRLERLQQDLVDFPDDSERARADRLGLPKSTVHRLLESMQK